MKSYFSQILLLSKKNDEVQEAVALRKWMEKSNLCF
jgi:hypothetical protein